MSDAHERRETYSAASIRANLGATPDEGTDDDSSDKDAVLVRLLTTDQRPAHRDPDALDELLEPPASQAPILTLARRTNLISKVAAELAVHHRTSGTLEQVLHRLRVAESRSQAEVAAMVNALTHELTRELPDSDDRDVTSEDITNIERTLVIVDDDYVRAVAAAWAATLNLETELVTRSFAKSLQLTEDSPALTFVAGLNDAPINADDPRVAAFEELYERAQDLRATANSRDQQD